MMQTKLDELSQLAEAEATLAEGKRLKPYQVLMVGDSTIRHQYGAICGFLGERKGLRFDPAVSDSIIVCRASCAEHRV